VLKDKCWKIRTYTVDMAFKAEHKTTFEPNKIIQPIYTGGSVALSQDGRVLASCLGEDVLLSDLATGEHLARIEGVRSHRYNRLSGTDVDQENRMAIS